MMATIKLDDQSLFKTNKVDNINSDRMLPPEFVRIQLTHSEMFPKEPFCVG